MSENLPLEALRLAREMTPVQPNERMQLEAILKMASALSQALFSGDFAVCIDCLGNLFNEGKKVGAVPAQNSFADTRVIYDRLPFGMGDGNGHFLDQVFSGHKVSSSVQDGESGKGVTTPFRAETVATSGDAALQPGTPGTGEGV